MSAIDDSELKRSPLKNEIDPIYDDKSSKMSLWAKASSVLNPLKTKNE